MVTPTSQPHGYQSHPLAIFPRNNMQCLKHNYKYYTCYNVVWIQGGCNGFSWNSLCKYECAGLAGDTLLVTVQGRGFRRLLSVDKSVFRLRKAIKVASNCWDLFLVSTTPFDNSRSATGYSFDLTANLLFWILTLFIKHYSVKLVAKIALPYATSLEICYSYLQYRCMLIQHKNNLFYLAYLTMATW